ncbi:unnamed protein product [Moneuplotes crassus]|uniref:Uncharacterized protein n=1 Tax=Euplotes crassus TaxID=5936 RepID=A0AAD1U982_EUPCR|nr:unnamed protein product [Moneuplotes crassus]
MKGKKLVSFKRSRCQLDKNKLNHSQKTQSNSFIHDLNKSLNNLINMDDKTLKGPLKFDKKCLPIIINRRKFNCEFLVEKNNDLTKQLNQSQKSRRLFSDRMKQSLRRKFRDKMKENKASNNKKINNSLGSLAKKERVFTQCNAPNNKSPMMMYPSLAKNFQSFSKNQCVNTNKEGQNNLQGEYSEVNFGLQDIIGRRNDSRDGIRRTIQDFISHTRSSKQDACSKINLKSFYLGKYQNPHLDNNRTTSYESINVKESKNSKFKGFQKFYQNIKKYSTLCEEPLVSGCCSPNSENLSMENSSSNMARFLPKDSHEDLDKLNFEMATKVKLISRKDILRKSDKSQSMDMQNRKYRRSIRKLKNSREREVIRYHKHKKTGSNFFIDTEDPNLISHGKVTPAQSTPTNKFQEMMPVYPSREVTIKTDGERKVKNIRKSLNLDRSFNPKLNSDYGLVLNTKYGLSNPRFGTNNEPDSSLNDSPLKRWKNHAKSGSQGRIQLLSNIFPS